MKPFQRLFGSQYFAITAVIAALITSIGCGSDDLQTQEPSGPFLLSGEITGLESGELQLENEAGELIDLSAEDSDFVFETEYDEGDDYEVTVVEQPSGFECTTENGEGTFEASDVDDVLVDCLSVADFQISVDESSSDLAAPAGEEIRVVANITNHGVLEGTQDVSLSIGDAFDAQETDVTLEENQTEVITFVWDTDIDDIGDYSAELSTDDDSTTFDITVTELEYFSVTIDSDDSRLTVTADQTVEVVANIENVGAQPGTQDIELTVDGNVVDSQPALNLNDGTEQAVQLFWTPDSDDRGEFDIEVSSDDSSDAATATIIDDAFFDVSINADNSDLEVLQNDPVTIEADIHNPGDIEATQDIELTANGLIVDATSLTVDGGATETISLEWNTDATQTGSYIAEVSSDDSSDTALVSVLAPSFFAVDIDQSASDLSAPAGDTIRVVTAIENTGGLSDTQDIVLDIGDHTITESDVTIDAGQTSIMTFNWETDDGDIGDHTATVSSDDDSASVSTSVSGVGYFDVTIDSADSTLEAPAQEGITLEVTVENTGTATAAQDVDLIIDGSIEDSQTVALDPDESESFSLLWDTDSVSPGNFIAEVASDDSSDFVVVTVLEPAFFAVDIDLFESPQEITQGWTAEIVADISNTGAVQGQQTIELHVDGDVVDHIDDLVIDAGDTETVTLFWDTDGAGGDYEPEVHSHDHFDSMSLFVEDDCSALVDIGDQCVDGTYFAGTFGGDAYYTTETSVGPSDTFRWGQNSTDTGATSSTDGQTNTATLMALDNSGAPYEAAEACGNLNENDRDDWFLPARDELLETIADNQDALPNVESTGHWSSTGTDGANNHIATGINMDGNSGFGTGKTSEHLVRCVRK